MICQIEKLSAGYNGLSIVEDFSLSLKEGEIVMLLGPTGCGKTTLLRALAGLIPIRQGSIQLGELLIKPEKLIPTEKRHIGMVFQDFALFPHLNVEKNIGFRARDRKPVEKWLDLLGLEPLRHAMPNTLSGGQKQRVALARSLAHQPAIMLLDEPLSNLDANLKDSLRWSIRKALKSAHIPSLWVTHDQEEALTIADRIAIMNAGRIVQLDTPERCFTEPANRFVAEFLGEASFLKATLLGDDAECSLGRFPVKAIGPKNKIVDLLVRPDDLSILQNKVPNAKVTWMRFEGGTRLYGIELNEGEALKIRASHELKLQSGQSVHVALTTNHRLTGFSTSDDVMTPAS